LGEGGNILGGAITSQDGTPMVSVGNSSITNASVAADLAISGGMLTLNNVPPLAGRTIVLSSPVGALSGGLALPWSGTLEGDTVRFDGGGEVGFINPAGGEAAGSLLTVAATSTIRTGSGSGRLSAVGMRLLNEGLISADGHQVQLLLDNFNNIGVVEARNGGRFEALSGNTHIQNLTDGTANGNAITNATLSDGTWAVYGNSTIAMANSTIARIDANVILDGPGSTFAALGSLNTNVGSFVLLHGRDFSTAGGFLNRGELTLGSGVDFRVAAGFRSTNMLHVILAGSDIESFGQLSAGTSALLAGSLDVQLDQNYQPNLGDSFTIISAGVVEGVFESVTFPQLTGGEAMAIT